MMRKITLLVCCLTAQAGCRAETGAVLEITGAPAPSSTCTFSPTASLFVFSGVYDPRGYGGYAPNGYSLGLRLANNTLQPTQDPWKDEAGRPGRINANDIHVAGFDVCWDLGSKHTEYGAGVLDCGTIDPSQRAFIAASTNVAAGGASIDVVDVLPTEHLAVTGVFGADFDPLNIPSVDILTGTLAPARTYGTNVSFSGFAESSIRPRDAAWGDFPESPANSARVVVALKAVGRTMDGHEVSSNTLTFPIDVVVGLLPATCGLPTTTCATTAGAFSGSALNLTGSCLPGAGGDITCTTIPCPTP